MSKISPFLWFEKEAEQAARFYVSLLADLRLDSVTTLPADSPSGPAGSIKVVSFTLAGQSYEALEAGPLDPFNRAISFLIHCDDQVEIDRLWDAHLKNGAKEAMCGWLIDRWGLHWQIVPRIVAAMMASPDRLAAQRAMRAMMTMVKLDIGALQKAFDGG